MIVPSAVQGMPHSATGSQAEQDRSPTERTLPQPGTLVRLHIVHEGLTHRLNSFFFPWIWSSCLLLSCMLSSCDCSLKAWSQGHASCQHLQAERKRRDSKGQQLAVKHRQ